MVYAPDWDGTQDVSGRPTRQGLGPIAQVVGADALIRTAREYLDKHATLSEALWDELARIALQAKRDGMRFKACREILARVDPIPRAPTVQVETGPVTIAWRSSSPTPLAPSSRPSTTPSTGPGHARPASSATDVLESL